MKPFRAEYSPVYGKTYSLFGKSDSTSEYYESIRMIADKIQAEYPDCSELLENLTKYSSGKSFLKKLLKNKRSDNMISFIINLIDPYLQKYTENTQEHLRTLPVKKRLDRRLATSREQYHLYMLEIELINRFFATSFKKVNKKIALLPYCLQDFSVRCKSEKNGFDYQCKNCSDKCYQNRASEILKIHHIEPYIWTQGNMKQLVKYTLKGKKTFGVLGIACIPELTMGMRNCLKNKIPVAGIPLNANRCVRWYGEFLPNSIDLTELEKLVEGC